MYSCWGARPKIINGQMPSGTGDKTKTSMVNWPQKNQHPFHLCNNAYRGEARQQKERRKKDQKMH